MKASEACPLPAVAIPTVGAPGTLVYVYRVFAAFVPPGVVTRTLAAAVVFAGVNAVMDVSLTTVTLVAAVPPNVTAVAPVNPVPVMVTAVATNWGALAGLTNVTVGLGKYVYSVFAAFVPPGVVTRTLAVPAVPAGRVAVMEVLLTITIEVATVPPIVTFVVPVNPVPVIVTAVPAVSTPPFGVMEVTVGTP